MGTFSHVRAFPSAEFKAVVFDLLGLRVRGNALGFLGFVLTYQILMSRSPWSATARGSWDCAAAGNSP